MSKYIIIILFSLLIGYTIYAICRPLTYTPSGKIKIAMFGRSTMALWFKHWNWPYPLRIKTTYRDWPIRYQTYARKNAFFEYHELPSPSKGKKFGSEMVKTFDTILNKGYYSAAFFKFCFVDYQVDQHQLKKRFDDLTNVIMEVVKSAGRNGVKLIVGTALPMPNPNKSTIQLQREFNQWLRDFAAKNENVYLFDLYTYLSDEHGRLKSFYCRGKGDQHLNDRAFSHLDKMFFDEINRIVASENL